MKRERGRPPHDDVLTPAEWRVVESVRHGKRNRQIAQGQGVSEEAIKFHLANALHKLGFKNRRELKLWDGVRRDSGLFKLEKDMSATLSMGPIGQIARSVKDITAASTFYGEVLGLKHLYTFGNIAFFDCGGIRLYLSTEGPAADSIIYFKVGDVRTAYEDLKGRGVSFTNAPHMIHRHPDGTEEWMAFFKDNEERPLAIMAQIKG
jgi:DNA-binding CsgD family transcriptional regulator/catechol 2,3-dioxygenase-like lactoylglutathione lyase family enzyme